MAIFRHFHNLSENILDTEILKLKEKVKESLMKNKAVKYTINNPEKCIVEL